MIAADLLTLARLPLGAAFVIVAGRPAWALALLLSAALTDVLDGPLARRQRQPGSRSHGDWLDPLCDKLFIGAVMLGLYVQLRAPGAALLVMLTREWLQLTSMVVYGVMPALRAVPYDYRAGRVGKAVTIVQFAGAGTALLHVPGLWPCALAAAGLGTISVGIYVGRLFRMR